MSRGPGRVQRYLLDALEQPDYVPVYVLAQRWASEHDVPATEALAAGFRRAALALARAGLIETATRQVPVGVTRRRFCYPSDVEGIYDVWREPIYRSVLLVAPAGVVLDQAAWSRLSDAQHAAHPCERYTARMSGRGFLTPTEGAA